MDSRKRFEADATLVIESIVNDGNATRIIASHRAYEPFTIRRTISAVAAIALLAILVTGTITESQAAEHAATPMAAVVVPHVPEVFGSPYTASSVPAPRATDPVPGPDFVLAVHMTFKARPVVAPVAPTTTATTTAAPVKSQSRIQIVIAYALRQQGKRYVFGTSGPNTFDCSGLVLAAYAQIGIKMYHFTGAMMGYGSKVSKAQMQPGDLIFPTSSHVGIYLGNGMAIFAPHSGTVVKIQKIYSFYTARHIMTG